MKVFLMHPEQDFDPQAQVPEHADDLIRDLELETLLAAMAGGDEYLLTVARAGVLHPLVDAAVIRYRQEILTDCLRHPDALRALYHLAAEAVAAEKKIWRTFWKSPDIILHRAVEVMGVFLGYLRQLRALTDTYAEMFSAPGLQRFVRMVGEELSDEYLQRVENHLAELSFRRGVLLSARLGRGNKGEDYTLHRYTERSLLQRIASGERRAAGYTFRIPDRDEAGHRALSELRGRGLNLVADALARSADHVLSFFAALRAELGFYLGCVQLAERLASLGCRWSFPDVHQPSARRFHARNLYDICLALTIGGPVVGNDVDADGKLLVLVTGPNQGGKSTFLRSVGLAQLLMQAGMFVPADALDASVAGGIFTHFKREEDPALRGGKLEEELARMSAIADLVHTGSVVLSNESFSATNEREGSEIAQQVIDAFMDCGVRVFFVTHLYDLARRYSERQDRRVLFLRAERLPDGRRTFRMIVGAPEPTSHAADSYRRIFGP